MGSATFMHLTINQNKQKDHPVKNSRGTK